MKNIILTALFIVVVAVSFIFLSWKIALALVLGAVVVSGVIAICRSFVFQMLWDAVRHPSEYKRELGETWDY